MVLRLDEGDGDAAVPRGGCRFAPAAATELEKL